MIKRCACNPLLMLCNLLRCCQCILGYLSGTATRGGCSSRGCNPSSANTIPVIFIKGDPGATTLPVHCFPAHSGWARSAFPKLFRPSLAVLQSLKAKWRILERLRPAEYTLYSFRG